MKTLETEFRSHGFNFRQIERKGRIAIFEKSKPHHKAPSYEVVKIRQHRERVMAGKTLEATEALPPSESWGSDGFTCNDLESAKKKFDQMCQNAVLSQSLKDSRRFDGKTTPSQGSPSTTP